MTDQRTKARLAVSEFQSASRTKFEAERDFTRAHDQLGKLLDDLITENEELRKLAQMERAHPVEGPREVIDKMNNLRRKLGLVTP
jgi:hypothetical protein